MAIVSNATVISVKNHGEEVKEILLKLDNYKRFEAGTFLQLTLENVTASERWPESRTFSISSYYNKDRTMRLIIKRVGKYTTRIFKELIEGKNCTVKYSFGEFVLPLFDNENEIICIAGGTGISPFLSFLECLDKEGGVERMKLFYSVRRKEDFIELEYLKKKLKNNQLFLHCTRENIEEGENRRIEIEDILNNIENKENTHFYICGSNEFISDFKRKLEENNINQIYIDEWN